MFALTHSGGLYQMRGFSKGARSGRRAEASPHIASDKGAVDMRREPSSSWEWSRRGAWLPVVALLAATACSQKSAPVAEPPATTPAPPATLPPYPSPTIVTQSYTNPLKVTLPGGGLMTNCPDPTVFRGQGNDTHWYLFCTADPLNDQDKDASGNYKQHLIAMLQSTDLVAWTYVGDAFKALPSWARADSDLWAPEVAYFNNKYHLYFTVVFNQDGDSSIGVATSDGPTGPWTVEDKPAVEPHEAPCCGNSKRWMYDPEVLITETGDKYIYYGSYYGGISVRKLSADGLSTDPYSQVDVTVANRYEAPNILKHGDYYYLLVSASNCCNGQLTGYSVFAGRSKSPTGPFVDREGVRLTYNRVGGTPVLSLNGNRWVGTGHNTVLTDFGGQDWILYHAIDRKDPYLASSPAEPFPPKRQPLMDALDWVDDWPVARGGLGASDTEQPAPAAQPDQKSRYTLVLATQDEPGAQLMAASEEFNGSSPGAQWSWTRPETADSKVEDGSFQFKTQAADLYQDINNASILWEPAPAGDYLVETKLTLDLPPVSCCHNYVQAGIAILRDDDNYVRLTHVSQWETRQIAFTKEVNPAVPAASNVFDGDTFGGPADQTVWMRISRRAQGDEELYTAWSSRDGSTWTRAGTWTHSLGTSPRIGLLSMGGTGFLASFDYVRVYELQ